VDRKKCSICLFSNSKIVNSRSEFVDEYNSPRSLAYHRSFDLPYFVHSLNFWNLAACCKRVENHKTNNCLESSRLPIWSLLNWSTYAVNIWHFHIQPSAPDIKNRDIDKKKFMIWNIHPHHDLPVLKNLMFTLFQFDLFIVADDEIKRWDTVQKVG